MNRRNFTQTTLIAGMGLATAPNIFPTIGYCVSPSIQFKICAPLGYVQTLGGDDPIDQLNFMADQGFTAFEDNSMNTRPVAVQEKWQRPCREI